MKLYEYVLCYALVLNRLTWGTFNIKNGTQIRQKILATAIFSERAKYTNTSKISKDKCAWLGKFTYQRKQCENEKIAEALVQAKNLAVSECEEQFRWNQWNCTNRKKLFKRVYRETAFLQSLAAASIMYTIAKSCASGVLQNCGCALENQSLANASWKWGNCGDNVMYAHSITKTFFQLNRKGRKIEKVINHDSEVGVKTTLANQYIESFCHGVSGSCGMRTQWRRLRSFKNIASQLKRGYHNAIKLKGMKAVVKQIRNLDSDNERLLYLTQGPNYCETIAGRRCKDPANCATLCCGHDFVITTEKVPQNCECKVINLKVNCKVCIKEEKIYTCL